ncbi:MAG: PEP-CTERM sorting domain-containing protein [Planctomycetota bacterium]
MKRFAKQLMAATAFVLAASTATAQITTDPYLFEAPSFGAADGTFEWDTLAGSVFAPFGTDPGLSSGTGTGTLDASDFTAQPMDGPPVPLITSTMNLYSGGTVVDFDVDLAGMDNTEAQTTVVLQIAVLGALEGFLLNGAAPTEFLDRGVAADVEHGLAASPFDTTYYWAEWQIATTDSVTIEFNNVATHTSLAAVRVDYINDASVIDATAPAQVPEPSGLALLLGGAALCGIRRRR